MSSFEKNKWFEPDVDQYQSYGTTGDTSIKKLLYGDAFGHSNRRQLAMPTEWDGLKDNEEEQSNIGLKFPVAMDNRPIYETQLAVNDAMRSGYRDLPGLNRINALIDPVDQVPLDRDQDRREPEDAGDNMNRDTDVQWFGNGSMEESKIVNNMKKSQSNKANPYKSLGRGKEPKDFRFNQLAAHKEYVPNEETSNDDLYLTDMEDGVETRPGIMGTIVNPVAFAPDGNISMNESKKDDVETLMDKLNPWRHPGSGGVATVVGKTFKASSTKKRSKSK